MKKCLLFFCFVALFVSAKSMGTLADGDLTSLSVTDDSDSIYVTIEGTLINGYAIYINIDDNEHTGYAEGNWTSMGADYIAIRGAAATDGYVNRYSGSAGEYSFNTYVGDVKNTDVSASERVIGIPKSNFDAPGVKSGSTIQVGYASLDATWAATDFFPDTMDMLSYTLTSDPKHEDIMISHDADSLYITVIGSDVDDSFDMFINADGDDTNGFQLWSHSTSSGAEYYVTSWDLELGGVYDYTGTAGGSVWSFSSTELGNVVLHRNTGEVIVAIDLDLISIGTDISVGMYGKGDVGSDAKLPSDGSFKSYATDMSVWNGSSWVNGTPGASDDVRIDSDYDAGTITADNLTVEVGATLTIPSGETLTVNGDLVVDGSIVIESGGSLLTYDANSMSGYPITFERNTRYSGGKYSFVGTPVQQHTSIAGEDLGQSVYSYNEVTPYDSDDGLSRWEDASGEAMVPGVGYTQAFQQALSFTGMPNMGTITVSGLSRTHDAGTASSARGWNLVSNPYPAAIDVTEFISDNSNIEGSIYLWDDHGSSGSRGDNSEYMAVSAIGSVSGPNGGSFSGYIGSSQGFFVQVSDETASTSVVFNESQRVSGDNADANFFRVGVAEKPSIKLALNGEYYNEILLGFREDATVGHDRLYDAVKLSGNQNISFYSFIENDRFAIQGLPELSKDLSVDLGYDLASSGFYNIEIVDSNNLEDVDVFLIDQKNGSEFNLSAQGSIELYLEAGAEVDDFRLEFRSKTVMRSEELADLNLNIYAGENHLTIEQFDLGFETVNINIYDLTGSKLYSFENQSFENNKWSGNISLQNHKIYVVSVQSDDQFVSRKILK